MVAIPDEAGPFNEDRQREGTRAVWSYFGAFAPAPQWDELVWWPPDVFTLANLVLDHTEGYRFVVAPPPGRRWPPLPDWSRQVRAAAQGWRDAGRREGCEPSPLVRSCWDTVTRNRGVPLAKIRVGEAWELTTALLTLHAIADEACAEVAACGRRASRRSFEGRAWSLLQKQGSLSRLSPTRVRIVPKAHFSGNGITIRSLSRYLALCYESVLPEAAVLPDVIPGLEQTLARHGATFLIAGVSQPASSSPFGRNYLHFGVRSRTGWDRYEQDKHHRWCVDEAQIRQYHLTRSLHPKRHWWEAIDIHERTLHVIDVGGGVTAAPLVCEDLARLDEVADLVRRIGPALVVAVLLDGPQLASRWPCRYASVIADDPGSAVLTLTSLGMAGRSRPPGKRRSRVVAHWNNRLDGLHEIALAPGAAAVLLSTTVESATLWTADGRCHRDVPRLRLSGVRQLRPRSA